MINDGFFMGANQKSQKNSKKSENTDKKEHENEIHKIRAFS